MTGDVKITMTNASSPGPPVVGGGNAFLGLNVCRGKGHKVLAFGQLLCGVGVVIIAFLTLINVFSAFFVLPFVVSLFTMVMGLMLVVSALKDTVFLATYFQFLRFPIGSGSLLCVAGAMMFGAYGLFGQIVGGTSFWWGFLMIVSHCVWRGKGAAFNVHLLS